MNSLDIKSPDCSLYENYDFTIGDLLYEIIRQALRLNLVSDIQLKAAVSICFWRGCVGCTLRIFGTERCPLFKSCATTALYHGTAHLYPEQYCRLLFVDSYGMARGALCL